MPSAAMEPNPFGNYSSDRFKDPAFRAQFKEACRRRAASSLAAFDAECSYSGIGADTVEFARSALTTAIELAKKAGNHELILQGREKWNRMAERFPSYFHSMTT